MPSEDPRMPHTRTSAPARPTPPPTTRDATPEPEEERRPPRHAGDESGTRGDRMPAGADEPGAGL